MDSEVQLEFHRQMKVIRKGSQINPNKYRKQEGRQRLSRFAAIFSLTLTTLAACSDTTGPTNPDLPAATGTYAGFDTSIYPGDIAMQTWLKPGSPYGWSGYYLPAPCHKDTTWAGRRSTLQTMGWGLAAIYVGQQTFDGVPIVLAARDAAAGGDSIPATARPTIAEDFGVAATCSRTLLSREQGLAEADDAIARMAQEGFPAGSYIYLDLERMESIPATMDAYYRAWVERILADGRYLSGIYCHKFNAQSIYAGVSEVFRASGTNASPRFWLASSTDFAITKRPTDIGFAFANMWQGILDTNQTWNGITLHIDVDISDRRSPSAP